ncbi:MAG: DNA topoisomerase III [Leptospirales bacterium]
MRLFIAEKPSLGRAIADCLPSPHRKGNGCIETGAGTVTWCFGHILEAAEPGDYDPKWKPWPGTPSDLPIVPKTWKLSPVPKAKEQLKIIKDLLGAATEIVHAGDPDREGQLLVDEVLEYLGNRKPVLRIWLSALDEKSVRQALSDLKPNDRFAPMKNAARARSQADWLVGMNLSRAYTISARKGGNPVAVLSVGRVQTPTLSLIVSRDLESEGFVPKDFFAVVARLAKASGGNFEALWTPPDNHPALDSEKRCIDRAEAVRIADRIKGQEGRLEVKKTDKSDPPPLPWSLSSLTMEASKKYGLSAKDVLDTAQSLYEKKLTTYPRTDCEYLPENQRSDIRDILAALAKRKDYAGLAEDADPALVSRAWNTEKVTAHHAIIPTLEAGSGMSLSDREAKIFDLVCRRYLAQFYQPCRYTETVVTLSLSGEPFRATGKTPVSVGWKSVTQTAEEEDREEQESTLPPLSSGDVVRCQDGTVKAKKTTPPNPYTDGTLIAAMKNVGKTLSDPGEKKILLETDGLGTEATRAAVIEGLLYRGYIEKSRKALLSTPKGRALIAAVESEVKSPAMTAIWERKLEAISGGADPAGFQREIEGHVRRLIDSALKKNVQIPIDGKRCPKCGNGILRRVNGKFGPFLGCSGYPDCRHMEKLPGTSPAKTPSPPKKSEKAPVRKKNTAKRKG